MLDLSPQNWGFRGQYRYSKVTDRNPRDIGLPINSRLIKVEVICQKINPRWHSAGYLRQIHKGLSQWEGTKLTFGGQVLLMGDLTPYTVRFHPEYWFPDGLFKVYEYQLPLTQADINRLSQFTNLSNSLVTNMNIVNPAQQQTTQTKQLDIKQDAASAATAIEVPGNQSRNGGTIINKGNKKLYVGFGFVADAGSPFVLQPGGNLDIDSGFVGPISVLFAAADPNQVANKTIAQVIEFVS
jgi:hypothetical protein